ncbi:MAG: filamentous hemagglutinin N-terminal domain-containing protein, partial [Gammaproteobacteria bacterium]
ALAQLPVPCGAGACGAGGPAVWVSSGAATSSVVARTLNINQTTDKAIFNWQSFNVGAGNTVNFHQPGSSAIALNRVLGNLGPSRIFGTINANGQVYLINPSGILFGKGAQVNVGALVASTLDVNDRVFRNNSILQPIVDGKPAFTGGSQTAAITVEKGATLRAADGGSIMIFAPTVTNAGDIETPDGQAVLAAGKDEVYLQQSSDPKLRGLVVEVKTGGNVTNLGKIAARRGDVTLLGFAVNQDGLVSATTSVRVNGSIRLLARDGAYVDTTGNTPVLTATSTSHHSTPATVTFADGSVTQVLPESDDPTTAPDSQVQNPSTVDVMGGAVTLKSGATIHAPAGKVKLTATANPGKPDAPPAAPNDSRIAMEDGSVIDVSGTTSTTLPMSRNTVKVNLRGYDLRDSPLQRNGSLYGKTITVDIRKGTPLADWQSTATTIGRTVDERSAHGGDVSFVSGGNVDVAKGAKVNVSGGSVTYRGGYVDTTKLVSNGKLYDISKADPNLQYQIAGQYTYTYRKWGVTRTWHGAAVGGLGDWQPGYVQGADAGSASFKTPVLALAGNIVAHTVQSPYQRYLAGQLPSGCQLASACRMPSGGSLNIDLNGTGNQGLPTQGVSFQNGDAGAAAQAVAGATRDLVIDSGALGAQGVSRVSVSTNNGAVHIAPGADLRLPAGGSVALTGDRLDIQGGVDIPGGTATFHAVAQGDANSPLTFGPASHVNVAGQWVNDSPLLNPDGAVGPVGIDGGDISVNAQGDVRLAAGSVLDVSGGAWLQSDGTVQGGSAGSIAVATAQRNGGSSMELGGELRGYALNGGGTLDLTANSISCSWRRTSSAAADSSPTG